MSDAANQARLPRAVFGNRSAWSSAVAFLFPLNILFALPVIVPTLHDIGNNDEAFYVEMGRRLAAGVLPNLDQSPVTVALFMLTYIPFQGSTFWFVHSCTAARFILFGLLWFSSYLLAKQVSENFTSGTSKELFVSVIAVFLLVFPALTVLITNGSHALFAAISTFALWEMLRFLDRKNPKQLLKVSGLLGLAFLTRVGEGTLLLLVFLTLTAFIAVRSGRLTSMIAAAVIPFAVLAGSFLLVNYLSTGRLPTDAGGYLYFTFEQGHGLAHSEKFTGRDFWVEGQLAAREVFGTPQENQYSVIRAIQRNPTAYLQRIPLLTASAIIGTVLLYGSLGLSLFLLALRGFIELIRQRRFMLLFTLLLWPCYGVLYLLIVFQQSHLLISFPIVLCFAAIGLITVASKIKVAERYLWSILIAVFVIFGLAVGDGEVSAKLVHGLIIFLLALQLAWIVLGRFPAVQLARTLPVAVILGSMCLARESPTLRHRRNLGNHPDERAVVALSNSFPPATPIAAYHPKTPWAAKMKWVPLHRIDVGVVRSDEDLRKWMTEKSVEGIYVEPDLEYNPSVKMLIDREIGTRLEVVFSDEEIRLVRRRDS